MSLSDRFPAVFLADSLAAGNPNLLASASFIECIEKNQRPFADELVGWNSAVAVATGVEAARRSSRVNIAARVGAREEREP